MKPIYNFIELITLKVIKIYYEIEVWGLVNLGIIGYLLPWFIICGFLVLLYYLI